MSEIHKLKSNVKSKRKRVGRGNGSGHGTYSTRGMKGQSARSGGRRRPGFEGGQTPYLRRLPKLKGFKNPNRVEFQAVNIGDLNVFDDKATVDKAALYEKNLIAKKNRPVKLLGGKGELEKTLTIKVDKASASAIKAVEAKKGKVELTAPTEQVQAEEKAEKTEKKESENKSE